MVVNMYKHNRVMWANYISTGCKFPTG